MRRLENSLKSEMVVVGGLNLGGSISARLPCFNAGRNRCRKDAVHAVMSISARKELNDLRDDVLAKVALFYYNDPRDALIKGLAE